jgi:poly-gamma-glutamate synthase PgsB/CapB
MAIDPDLQAVSEHDMVRATIGVVTNARADHGDVMGPTAADVARALCATVPAGGVLVLGDVPDSAPFEAEARRRGTAVVRPAADLPRGHRPAWQDDNRALALAVVRQLGVADDVALAAMDAAREDPGAMTVTTSTVAGRAVAFVDASAANDPESLARLLDGGALPGERLFVFNHRADRPMRLRQFAAAALWQGPGLSVLVTGDTPDCATRKRVGLALDATRLGFAPLPLAPRTVRDQLRDDPRIATVILCGNAKGLDARGFAAAVATVATETVATETAETGRG